MIAYYDWIKAAHVIVVIAWMAGMLYLPRLFVYHADAKPGSELSETLKVMERRLLRAIIDPAMGLAWILGLTMGYLNDLWGEPWFQVKLVLVVLMSIVHSVLSRWRRDFEKDARLHTARFYRVGNEVVTVIMIAIVIMVIVRPF